MRRGFTVAALLTTIVVSFGYAILRYQANSQQEDTWFNTHWRPAFAKHAPLRWLLGLHWDGDQRATYLHIPADENLALVVVQDPNVTLPAHVLELAAEQIGSALSIPGRVSIVEGGTLTSSPAYTTAQLRRLPRPDAPTKSAALYVYVLTSSVDAPSNLGSTIREDGLALFMTELTSLANRNPDTLTPLVLSTVLHEVGHQLGLPHSEDVTCSMASTIEQPSATPQSVSSIPVDFCPAERAQIAALQQAR